MSCVSAGLFDWGGEDSVETADISDISLIKTSTDYDVGTSSGHPLYEYNLKGVLENLPENMEGYTVRGLFYDGDKIVGHKDQDLDLVSYSSQTSDPSTIVFLQRYEPVTIDTIELLIMDSEGNIVLDEFVPFNMNSTEN